MDARPPASRQLANSTCCTWCYIPRVIELCPAASYPSGILQNGPCRQLPLAGPRADLQSDRLAYTRVSCCVFVNQNSLVQLLLASVLQASLSRRHIRAQGTRFGGLLSLSWLHRHGPGGALGVRQRLGHVHSVMGCVVSPNILTPSTPLGPYLGRGIFKEVMKVN